MRRTTEVLIADEARSVELIHYNQQGARDSATFEYNPDWLAAAERFAVDPALPLVTSPQFHRKTSDGSVFHPAIADTEPDGWVRRVIQRDHTKRRQEARRFGQDVDARPVNRRNRLSPHSKMRPMGKLSPD
jgi:serine/threonine-protein kinase HipA